MTQFNRLAITATSKQGHNSNTPQGCKYKYFCSQQSSTDVSTSKVTLCTIMGFCMVSHWTRFGITVAKCKCSILYYIIPSVLYYTSYTILYLLYYTTPLILYYTSYTILYLLYYTIPPVLYYTSCTILYYTSCRLHKVLAQCKLFKWIETHQSVLPISSSYKQCPALIHTARNNTKRHTTAAIFTSQACGFGNFPFVTQLLVDQSDYSTCQQRKMVYISPTGKECIDKPAPLGVCDICISVMWI